jgi:FkbM family methyltransferase
MLRIFHISRRKLKTLGLTIRRCKNWPIIVATKLRLAPSPPTIKFRNGLQLQPMPPLKKTWGEVFEPAIADIYHIGSSEPELIIDVGANIGAFSCLAAYLHPHAVVHSFEPSDRHADLLRANIRLNRLANVTVHQKPVTKDSRDVVFYTIGSGGSSGIFLTDHQTSAVKLSSVSLSQIAFAGHESVFVKLDCEGAEGEIIQWLCENLHNLPSRIRLACEYHHWCPVPLEQSLASLRAHGFSATVETPFDECYILASFARQPNSEAGACGKPDAIMLSTLVPSPSLRIPSTDA